MGVPTNKVPRHEITSHTVTDTASTLIQGRPLRRYLSVQNTGTTYDVWVAYGQEAVAGGAGTLLAPYGSEVMDVKETVPPQYVSAVCASGETTTVVVKET